MLNFFFVTEGAGARRNIGNHLSAFMHPYIGALNRLAVFFSEGYVLEPAILIPGSLNDITGIFAVVDCTGLR